jgi:hypothetical protein
MGISKIQFFSHGRYKKTFFFTWEFQKINFFQMGIAKKKKKGFY